MLRIAILIGKVIIIITKDINSGHSRRRLYVQLYGSVGVISCSTDIALFKSISEFVYTK